MPPEIAELFVEVRPVHAAQNRGEKNASSHETGDGNSATAKEGKRQSKKEIQELQGDSAPVSPRRSLNLLVRTRFPSLGLQTNATVTPQASPT